MILVSGMILGSGFTVMVLWRHATHKAAHPEEAPDRITRHLRRRLKLTSEQTKAIHAIVKRHADVLDEIRLEVEPRVYEELHAAKIEIEQVLTPRQAKRWNRTVEIMRKRWFSHIQGQAAASKERDLGT